MYYHASPIGGLTRLDPHSSNHHTPLVYFSRKRENVLVYLSNAIERYCKDTGFCYTGDWMKWGPYRFNNDGRLRMEEYYPNALERTYKGVSGYIYCVEEIEDSGFQTNIPDVVTSSASVTVKSIEFIPDDYAAILQAEKDGLITIMRYEEASDKMLQWIKETFSREFETSNDHPEYQHFLKGCFPEVLM